jgi:ABC-type lipoprotein release transport system permease subunit
LSSVIGEQVQRLMEPISVYNSWVKGMRHMRLFLRMAWRNIWRNRRRTLIVLSAIGLTLALMMFYDGIVAGFEQSIYGNAIKVLGGNIQIHAEGYRAAADQAPLLPLADDSAVVEAVLSRPQVLEAARRIQTQGLATSREGAFAVGIVGVEPEKEQPVSLVAQTVIAGRYLRAEDEDMVFIGKGLADAMGVTVGDRITLAGRATHNQMRQRTMTVLGIYDVGLRDIEKRTVYISLGEAQSLYGLSGQSTEVAISLQQIGQEATVMGALKKMLPGYEIDSWETNFPDLQKTIATKGAVMNIFSVILLIVAGIGILNVLLMAVYERTREIGILAALGLRPRQISLLFLLEGAMLGLVGVAFGMGLGLLINLLVGRVGMDYSQFSSLTEYTALISGRVYPTLGVERLFQRAMTALVIAVLASFYPSREAAHREPAEALHYV